MKTAGLLALMALSGLHVPAQAARVPLYASVLADIGDRQSLAAHLSTFTAHIAKPVDPDELFELVQRLASENRIKEGKD